MNAVDGEWTSELSGGCPKYESWHQNPQFQLWSTGGTYSLVLRQHASPDNLAQIGLWVMKADDQESRKRHIKSEDTVGKSKFKAAEEQTLTLSLPLREGDLPYIVICATYEPMRLGKFTLIASATEDESPRLVPLQQAPAGMDGTVASKLGSLHSHAGTLGTMQPSLGDFNPTGPKQTIGSNGSSHPARQVARGPPPSNEPVVEVEGQGLSKKLEANLAALVEVALQPHVEARDAECIAAHIGHAPLTVTASLAPR